MRPTPESATEILEHGLWRGNTGLVALLGLCPLLAVSATAVHALALGVATLLASTGTGLVVSLLRRWSRHEVRLPAFALIVAALVTSIELAMHALLPELHRALGLFLPLVVTNCAILARAETFASQRGPDAALLDGFAIGLGFLALLLVLGITRELIGAGTLFAGAGTMLGLPGLELSLREGYRGFLLAALPPGAFVLLGLLIALKQRLGAKRA